LSRAGAAATAAPTPRPITVILRGHPFAHSLTKETRASCLDAERPGGYTVAAGALGGRSCSGGSDQRVVGVQVRGACRHLAAYAESATGWTIRPRRLDPRAG